MEWSGESSSSETLGVTNQAARGEAVLVVDDDPMVVTLLATSLRRDGYEADTAANGAIALEKLKERAYDLIVCDLKMPVLDGMGLYREVERHHPRLAHRFIFVTGSFPGLDITTFFKETGVPYLCKPFRLAEVRRVVQWVLESNPQA